MSKLRTASIVFLISTFVLKFSSMIRDLVIAGLFGDSYTADAYLAALTIPNAIILFMLTGMKDAFLPSYIQYDKRGQGFSHLTNVAKGTAGICLFISLIGALLSPWLVRMLYPEFAKYEHGIQIATWTSALYFLSIPFVGINSVYEGFFDAKKKFSFSTLSQTIVVVSTVGSALFFHKKLGIYALPIGYLAGTLLSLVVKIIYTTPGKFLVWTQKLDKSEVKKFYAVFMPVGLTIAVGQINLMVNMLFAARLGEGVVANLNYAFRLVNIPQAIFGVTIATIVFPFLSEKKLFTYGIERGLAFMFLFLAPTITGMVLLMEPLVKIVYERGAFGPTATTETAQFALFYMGSVLFYSIQAVIAKGFYILEKGHYMMRIGFISIGVNILSNWILSNFMGAPGLALSASVVGLIYSVATFITLFNLTEGFNLRYLAVEYGKVLAASALMAVVLAALLPGHGFIYLITMTIIGTAVYFVSLFLLKSQSLRELLGGKNEKSFVQNKPN